MDPTWLMSLGAAAIAYWWLNRKGDKEEEERNKPLPEPLVPSVPEPDTPNDVTPNRKTRFENIESCWYSLDGMKDHLCFKESSEAQAAITTLKGILAAELSK